MSGQFEPLALLGGPQTITGPLHRFNPIGPEESAAAKAVVDSGVLSKFLGPVFDRVTLERGASVTSVAAVS